MLPKNNYNNFYCPALWKQVHVSTRGQIAPCCVWSDFDKDWKNSKVKKPLDNNMQNNHDIVEARKIVLDNKVPISCSYCVKQEAQGIKSQREELIEKLGPIDEKKFNKDSIEIVNDDNIEYLDIRPGNTCNFMCNFCSPFSSHLIAKEYEKNNTLQAEHTDLVKSEVKMDFVKNVPRYKNLKFVHIAGGEPFFMKKELLEIVTAIQNKESVVLRILTNTSVYDEEIIKKLEQFKTVQLMMSIDAVGRPIEISRWRSNWKLIDENIQKFKKLRNKFLLVFGKQFKLMMVPAIGLYTVNSLPELLEYATKNKIYAHVIFIQDPMNQVVNMIPDVELLKIRGRLEQMFLIKNIEEKYCNSSDIFKQLDYYIKNNNVKPNTINSFWQWQSYWEKNRNYSLKKELPEVYEMIKKI